MGNWNKDVRRLAVLLGTFLLTALFFGLSAFAGWNTSKDTKEVTYTNDAGETATGLKKIGSRYYYFDKKGILATGWTNTPDGYRYFMTKGKAGAELGSMMYDGVFEIDGELYAFDEDGIVLTGYQVLGEDEYYFGTSKKPGERGKAVRNGFQDLPDGRRSYFDNKGRMVYDQWVEGKKYYVDENGSMLRETVTDEGVVFKKDGTVKKTLSKSGFFKLGENYYFYKKGKGLLKDKVFKYKQEYYYVDKKGIRQSGWVTWKSDTYYFLEDGEAAVGKKKLKGVIYTFNSQGKLKGKRNENEEKDSSDIKVLILCGHGQGDPGAVGCNGKYTESVYTRDFGKRIYDALLEIEGVDADLYKTKYDMFQQMRRTVNASSFSGSGSRKKSVLRAIKTNAKIPELTQYDYVLEVHFNATVPSGKDPGGNGRKKGTGTYVNYYKSAANRKIDRKIIAALNGVGLNTWGNGVYRSTGLLNAKAFTEIGVNYSLLETCFIDDKDDMKFYLKKCDKMAEAVAKAIVRFFR